MKLTVIFSISTVTLLGVAARVFFGADASATAPTARHTEVATPEEWIARREQIKQLRTELARQGAYAFVTNSITAGRKSMRIHSRFWVDRLPRGSVGLIAYENELRNWGLDFVSELERLSSTDIPIDDIAKNEERASQMIKIARWLGAESGYGNYILKNGVRDWRYQRLGLCPLIHNMRPIKWCDC